MKTGFQGTFVISWSQTEVDGLRAAPEAALRIGAQWRWTGEAVRVDGPRGILPLGDARGATDIRKRAALSVRRLLRAAEAEEGRVPLPDSAEALAAEAEAEAPLFDDHMVVTDGRATWTVTRVALEAGRPLLMFVGEIPPREVDLWVVSLQSAPQVTPADAPGPGGIICFTPGALIDTPEGRKRVESLIEGDRIETADDGPQEIQWIGTRRISGARMVAMPELRPVRLLSGALGDGVPDPGLLVSPDHRILVTGDRARALFNTEEVLVTAKDLVDGERIGFDFTVKAVRYIHLLLPRHAVVFANGVRSESFHPAAAKLEALDAEDAAELRERLPEMGEDGEGYGGYARRTLTAPEAAILKHDAA